MIGAWDGVFDLTRPDLIVCEHAPSAGLSAFGRIPVAFVGNGFVVPPCNGDEFAPFEKGKGEPARQRHVFAAMQEALAALGRAVPATICEPFRGMFRGVYTFPALDPYRGVRQEAVLGPIEPLPVLGALPTTRRLFAYSAANNPMVNELTQALMDFGPEASVFVRGSLGARGAVLKSRGVRVYDTAPSLPAVLRDAGVVFSHGGMGFTHAALTSGRPHIVSPRHLEALMTGRRLEELGAGMVVNPFESKLFREAVRRGFEDDTVRAAAQKAGAAAHEFMKTATPLETTIAALRIILK
jgi:UDP-N-acetylglucosamine transferase subunit ALG13